MNLATFSDTSLKNHFREFAVWAAVGDGQIEPGVARWGSVSLEIAWFTWLN